MPRPDVPKGQCPITRQDLSEKERMSRGFAYRPYPDPELVAARAKAHSLFAEYNRTEGVEDVEARRGILKKLLGSFGEGIYIEPPFRVDYGFNIHVGKYFYCNFGCILLDCAPITVGDYVALGPNVQIYTPIHPLNPEQRVTGLEGALPVKIGNHVWVGGGAIILPGVTIGNDCVIGAGAVVTKDVPDFSVVAGNPAKVIKDARNEKPWKVYPDSEFPDGVTMCTPYDASMYPPI